MIPALDRLKFCCVYVLVPKSLGNDPSRPNWDVIPTLTSSNYEKTQAVRKGSGSRLCLVRVYKKSGFKKRNFQNMNKAVNVL